MSREIKDDYEKLLGFISDYSIKDEYQDPELTKIIKSIHKHYYSSLVMMAELKHQKIKPITSFTGNDDETQQKIFWMYMSESISELGSVFFLILNGAYKAGNQVLRSSIENFVKAHGSLDELNLIQTKNIYDVFGRTGATPFFSSEPGRGYFQILSDMYGDLCSTVHTGTVADMQHVSALGDFPAINIGGSEKSKDKYVKIVKAIVSATCIRFSESFHAMHHRNQDIVQASLSKNALLALHRKEEAKQK